MNAADIINGLIRAGVAVKDAVSKAETGNGIDYEKLLNVIASDPGLAATVSGFIAAIEPADVKSAIEEIDAKQKALLNGRSVADLHPTDLLKYSDLADARLVLATRQLQSALNPSLLEWLMKEALPTLVDVAPVVLPLLL